MDVKNLLDEREKTHGWYPYVAGAAQAMKDMMRSAPNWALLDACQRESLDMIANKLARIMYGDPDHADHWRDVAGYAMLIVDGPRDEEE